MRISPERSQEKSGSSEIEKGKKRQISFRLREDKEKDEECHCTPPISLGDRKRKRSAVSTSQSGENAGNFLELRCKMEAPLKEETPTSQDTQHGTALMRKVNAPVNDGIYPRLRLANVWKTEEVTKLVTMIEDRRSKWIKSHKHSNEKEDGRKRKTMGRPAGQVLEGLGQTGWQNPEDSEDSTTSRTHIFLSVPLSSECDILCAVSQHAQLHMFWPWLKTYCSAPLLKRLHPIFHTVSLDPVGTVDWNIDYCMNNSAGRAAVWPNGQPTSTSRSTTSTRPSYSQTRQTHTRQSRTSPRT